MNFQIFFQCFLFMLFFVYKTKRKTIFVFILYLLMVVNLFYTYICLLCNYSLLGFHLLKLCFTSWCLNEISVVQPFFHKFITFFGVFLWVLFVWMLFFWLFFYDYCLFNVIFFGYIYFSKNTYCKQSRAGNSH